MLNGFLLIKRTFKRALLQKLRPMGYYQYHGKGLGEVGSDAAIEAFLMGKDIEEPGALKREYFKNSGYNDDKAWWDLVNRPNQWPDEQFQNNMNTLWNSCSETTLQMLTLMGEALGKEKDYFTNMHNHMDANLELKLYHANEDKTPSVRVKSHADLTSITLLMQDFGGLEVYDTKNSIWCKVPVVQDAVLVNTGNIMEMWTDGEFKSAKHRVVSEGDSPARSSIVFFAIPDWHARLKVGEYDMVGDVYPM